MATVSKGHTYQAGEKVTHTSLNAHVDDATVSDIAQADIEANSGIIVRSSSAPTDTDAAWYDTTNNVLKIYSGSGWVQVGAAIDMIQGLTLANNATDATNDIDISVGSAMDSTNVLQMNLSSAFVKQIDAAFAEGTAAGGRDSSDNLTGAKWFHVYLIGDTTSNKSPDIFISTSTTPTPPTGWDVYRRIGSILWDGSAIVLFTWSGDGRSPVIQLDELATASLNEASPSTSFVDVDLSDYVPPTSNRVEIYYEIGDSDSTSASLYVRKNGSSAAAADSLLASIGSGGAASIALYGTAWVVCDTSQVIEYACASGDGGVGYEFVIRVKSYVDER